MKLDSIVLTHHADEVVQWNKAAGKLPEHPDYIQIMQQFLLVLEEADETAHAFEQEDQVEVLDGVCDVFVVASYALHLAAGATLSSWFETEEFTNFTDVECVAELKRLRKTWVDASSSSDKPSVNMITALSLVALRSALRLSETLDGDFIGALKAVNENNASKFPTSPDIVDKTVDLYEEQKVEVNAVETFYNGKPCYVIKRASDGKIMKPYGFVSVDLKPYVSATTV